MLTHRTLTRTLGLALTLLLSLALLSPQPANGKSRRRGRRAPPPMAELDVRTMVSTQHAGYVLRAIIGIEEIYAYLVVERIRRGETEGDRDVLIRQKRIDKYAIGGRTQAFPMDPQITRLRWQGVTLHFQLTDNNIVWRCLLSAGKRSSFLPRCEAIHRAGAGNPKIRPDPRRPTSNPRIHDRVQRNNWAGDPRVVKACGRNFSGSEAKNGCIKIASRYLIDPTRTIEACGKLMSGSKGKTKCLLVSRKVTSDHTEGLYACNKVVSGAKNRISCFKLAIHASWPTTSAIHACGQAMSGSRNVLNCILIATQASQDPTAAIAACRETMSGAKNRLKCIRNATGR